MTTSTLQGKKSCNSCNRRFRTIGVARAEKGARRGGRKNAGRFSGRQESQRLESQGVGNEVPVDISLDSANADEFDALLLPGG